MEDKTFELLSRMYGEFSEFREGTEEFQKNITQKVQENSNHIIRLENELKGDIKALYDGYKQTYEKLNVLENKVDDISAKIEKQEVEIKVIKGGKV